MRLRDDHHGHTDPPEEPCETDSSRGDLRAQADALLAAADDAINRALSKNSLEFLEQHRQAGGQ
jgi:hypothetical protein